jgi:hypothetical protein
MESPKRTTWGMSAALDKAGGCPAVPYQSGGTAGVPEPGGGPFTLKAFIHKGCGLFPAAPLIINPKRLIYNL